MDKYLRNLERFQDPIKLKLLQRRLGQGVYIQETPRPIQVFNYTELLIDISQEELGDRSGKGSGYGNGYGFGSVGAIEDGAGLGHGLGHGNGSGVGYGNGYGHGSGHGVEYGSGYGDGTGSGYGSQLGGSERFYTQDLREKFNDR